MVPTRLFQRDRQVFNLTTLKRKCLHFDEIYITGCTGSCQYDNWKCSQTDVFVWVEYDLFLNCYIVDTLQIGSDDCKLLIKLAVVNIVYLEKLKLKDMKPALIFISF